MKIIRKPRPVGNEFKNLCDGHTKIVLHLELYEGKEYMQTKAFVSEFGATTATSLRLTDAWKHTGKIFYRAILSTYSNLVLFEM